MGVLESVPCLCSGPFLFGRCMAPEKPGWGAWFPVHGSSLCPLGGPPPGLSTHELALASTFLGKVQFPSQPFCFPRTCGSRA